MKCLVCLLVVLAVAGGCKRSQQVENTLDLPLIAKIKGMDPIYTNDRYSGKAVGLVYEGLLSYHYLKRPFVLEPNLALSMPEVKDNGLTYVFKLRRGLLFHDDKCFKDGNGREVVAEDVVYSFKRTAAEPAALGWWVVDGKIAGLNNYREQVASGKASFDTPVEGVRAADRYTVEFKLTRPFPQFAYALTMPFFYVVPREAVEHYGKEFVNHPVGTGPFTLERFDHTNRVTFYKNPSFREKYYPKEGMPEDEQAGLLIHAGQRLPLVDRMTFHINLESMPRWLSFQAGKFDLLAIPKDNFDTAVTPSKDLTPEMRRKGIQLDITPALDITYTAFQHSNPLFQNADLRRAMSLAYDPQMADTLFYSSTSLVAQSIVPPGIAGFVEGMTGPWRGLNVEKAKKVLAKAGFPGGKGLPKITLDTTATTVGRQIGEFFKKCMAAIGINVEVISNPWPELQKKIQTRQTMLHALSWSADYPDAENFLQLLYGPNQTPGANGSNYNNNKFNQLYERAHLLQDSTERTKLYEQMYRMAANEVPLIYGSHRQKYTLTQGWLTNFKYMEFDQGVEQYYGIDLEKKEEFLKQF